MPFVDGAEIGETLQRRNDHHHTLSRKGPKAIAIAEVQCATGGGVCNAVHNTKQIFFSHELYFLLLYRQRLDSVTCVFDCALLDLLLLFFLFGISDD